MKIKNWVLAVCLAVLSVANTANAGTISNFIGGLPSHTDHHNDASHEYLAVDGGTPGTLDVGDVLSGIFIIESVGVSGGTIGAGTRLSTNGAGGTPELTGYFSTTITSKTVTTFGSSPTGNLYTYTFGPTASFESTYGTGALVAMFEDSTADFDPSAANVAAAIASATDGALQGVFGFTGAGGIAQNGEGWQGTSQTDQIGSLPINSGGFSNGYTAYLNMLVASGGDYTGLNILFTQVSTLGAGLTQFAVNGQFYSQNNTNFPVGDSTDFFFDVLSTVPEPASIVVFGLGACIFGCGAIAKRRRSA